MPFQFEGEQNKLIEENEKFAAIVLKDLLIKGREYPKGLADDVYVMGGCSTLLGELYMRKANKAAIKNN